MVKTDNGKVEPVIIGQRYDDRNGQWLRTMETDDDVALRFTVHHAENVDNPSSYPSLAVEDRIYCVVFSLEPGIDFCTYRAEGLFNPVWRETFTIKLNDAVYKYPVVNVEVIRLHSRPSDPGCSSGMSVVGRAKIPLPKEVAVRKDGRFGLVRFGDKGCKAEGHIVVSMELENI